MKSLLERSPSSKPLSKLWEHVLEEERTLHRRFEARKRFVKTNQEAATIVFTLFIVHPTRDVQQRNTLIAFRRGDKQTSSGVILSRA